MGAHQPEKKKRDTPGSPPRYAQKLLTLFLRDELLEEVMGDLEEKYLVNIARFSGPRARLNYWYQVFHYLRPFAIKTFRSGPLYYHGMIANYSKITIRNLGKQKLYAFLNIGGLAVGIAAFLMIVLFVQYEFSYDRFLPNSSNVYRIYQKQAGNLYLGSEYFAVTPIQLAQVLRDEFPEIEHATTLHTDQTLLQVDDETFLESGITTDEHFFHSISYQSLKASLTDPVHSLKSN